MASENKKRKARNTYLSNGADKKDGKLKGEMYFTKRQRKKNNAIDEINWNLRKGDWVTCKECKFGKQCKYGIYCRLKDRCLVTDRAENCNDYDLKTEIKRYRERTKEREE